MAIKTHEIPLDLTSRAAKATTPQSRAPPTLSALPTELVLKIFSYLCPGNSACLGLTCKRFYECHRQLHGNVSLKEWCHTDRSLGRRLYELLEEWYLPGFVHCWCGYSTVRAVMVSLVSSYIWIPLSKKEG
jgi:hypothetical protein